MRKKCNQSYSIPLRLQRAAGIDCHQPTFVVAVCVEGEVPLVNTFDTDTESVYLLKDYLLEHGIKDVIIESTGVYWRFIYRVLSASVLTLLWSILLL